MRVQPEGQDYPRSGSRQGHKRGEIVQLEQSLTVCVNIVFEREGQRSVAVYETPTQRKNIV